MITVAIPAYKSKYLKEAIQSVINQTYKDFELIILNDGSSEYIDSIVSQFRDERINYYKNEINIGKNNLVGVWNQCLSLASGEFFVLFSDDDVYHRDFLKEMISLADRLPHIDILHCRVRIIDENNRTLTYTPLCPEWETVFDFIWHRIKFFRYHYASEFMCRTSSLKKIGGFVKFPLGWSTDDATWFMMSKDNGIGYTLKPLCNWRQSPINISQSGNLELRLRAILEYSDWLVKFTDSLQTKDEVQKDLCVEIKNSIRNWTESAKRTVLLRDARDELFPIIKLFLNWIRLGGAYKISLETLFKTSLSLLKVKKNK